VPKQTSVEWDLYATNDALTTHNQLMNVKAVPDSEGGY
jgi:hypothetical protein